jgi:hypothetical protein
MLFVSVFQSKLKVKLKYSNLLFNQELHCDRAGQLSGLLTFMNPWPSAKQKALHQTHLFQLLASGCLPELILATCKYAAKLGTNFAITTEIVSICQPMDI